MTKIWFTWILRETHLQYWQFFDNTNKSPLEAFIVHTGRDSNPLPSTWLLEIIWHWPPRLVLTKMADFFIFWNFDRSNRFLVSSVSAQVTTTKSDSESKASSPTNSAPDSNSGNKMSTRSLGSVPGLLSVRKSWALISSKVYSGSSCSSEVELSPHKHEV